MNTLTAIFSNRYFKITATLGILAYLGWQIDFALLVAALRQVNYRHLPILTIVTVSFWIMNVIGLYWLLIPIGKLHFPTFFKFQLQSILLGSLTPMQLGETMIFMYLQKARFPLQKFLAAFLVNKVVHLLCMIFTGFIFLHYLQVPLFAIFAGSLVVMLGIWGIIQSRLRITIREWIIKRYVPQYYDFFELTSDYLRKYRRYFLLNVCSNMLKILIAGVVIWINFLLFKITCDFWLLLSVYNLARILSLLPISIGGLGFVEGGVALSLARLGLNYSVVILAMFFLRVWFILMDSGVLLYYLYRQESVKNASIS